MINFVRVPVAQGIEHLPSKQRVVGPNPTRDTIYMERNTLTPNENNAVEEFAKLALEYIHLVEKVPDLKAHQFLVECSVLLPKLYAGAQILPDIWAIGEYEDAQVETPFGVISDKLGKYDFYHDVYDPVFDEDIQYHPISEDLAEIYVDLKRQILKFELGGDHRIEAIWNWRFGFQMHWGNHLLGAMRPMHWLIYNHMGSDYDALLDSRNKPSDQEINGPN